MGPLSGQDGSEDEIEEVQREEGAEEVPNFAELLGPHCVIQRVDKDKNVLGTAEPEEMRRELTSRAGAQRRLGACAEHVKEIYDDTYIYI